MATKMLKLRQIGGSTGAIFPKDVLDKLKVGEGDSLFVVESPDGILLTPYDPELEEQLEIGRRFMRKNKNAFRALAK